MQEWQNAPFKQTQNSYLINGHILSHDDLIIRGGTEFDFVGNLGVDTVLEGLNQASKLFEELTDYYGIEHAGFMPVVGAFDTGTTGEYIVSSRIAGENCVDPNNDKVPETQHHAARDLLGKLTIYAKSKQEAGESMLTDVFNLRQYVYVPEKDTMVLIDTDPYFEKELHCSIAFTDLRFLALQILPTEAFEEWDIDMTKLSRQSEMLVFDPNF